MDLNGQASDLAAVYIICGTCWLIWVMYMTAKFLDDFTSRKTKLVWEDAMMFLLLGIVAQVGFAIDAAGLVELKLITVPEAIALNIAVIPVYVSLTWLFVMWARGDYDKPVVVSAAQPAVKGPVLKTTLNIAATVGGIGAMCVILVLL